jgi:hypothetical protein
MSFIKYPFDKPFFSVVNLDCGWLRVVEYLARERIRCCGP